MSADWDLRFLDLAAHVAQWSKDPSTKVGAVLVSPDRYVVIPGYNGFPRGVTDDPGLYEDRAKKYERVVHAETNAILNCPMRPVGWTLYCAPLPPCNECAKLIIQAGVGRVVAPAMDAYFSPRWTKWHGIAHEMFQQAGVQIG